VIRFNMNITVILCTYNRCQSLAKALDSVVASTLPESIEWEVLVVDNNSTDRTHEVVEDYCRRYPTKLRYVFEPKPGKSHALKAGIQEARGDILAFIDDDVTVEPTWLQNLTAALHNGQWVGAGGRILPAQTFLPPAWLPLKDRYALAPLALFDLGPRGEPLTEAPFGTNMAFQKKVFEKYHGFRTDLGPRPGSEIRNEDTEFGQRLLAAGEQLLYEPSAVVYHSVSPNRLRKRYFLTWWFDKARADICQFGIPHAKWFVAGIPLYLFRRLAVWTVRWIVALDPSRRFSNKTKTWTVAGQILECYRQSPGHHGKTS
jgi:glycosyltransferase involved in cell wall biosynthesis